MSPVVALVAATALLCAHAATSVYAFPSSFDALFGSADSCAISDNDRTDCGFSGINQSGCEAKGCCWNPATIQGRPWCFYPNGDLPSPSPTPSPAVNLPQCDVIVSNRTDCGFSGINQSGCESKSCCWNPSTVSGAPWCHYRFGEGPGPDTKPPTGSCSTYNGLDSCAGDAVSYPESINSRRWQTPPRGDNRWVNTFQDYSHLVGYPSVTYDSSHQTATVEVKTRTRVTDCKLLYQYGEGAPWSTSSFASFSASAGDKDVVITVAGAGCGFEGADVTLVLDSVHFLWQNPVVQQPSQYQNGQKGAIVELFGWPYNDVAKECELLGKAGYMGVKLFPVQEMVETDYWLQEGTRNPWYFMYQPTSYRLRGRMGTREELRNLIDTCRSYNVRVYADAVVNHMSGGGNDVQDHRNQAGGSCVTWGPKNSTYGAPYYTHAFTFEESPYSGARPTQEYPAVPFGPDDFHCDRPLNSWASGFVLNYGWLVGLTDLRTESPYVRERIADFFVDLLGFGFSGFRVDAAKHIRPDDLAAIFGIMKKKLGNNIPADFITWLEVIMGGEKDLLACNDNDYNYYNYFNSVMSGNSLTDTDIAKIKIWSSDYPKEMPICGRWIIPPSRFVIQNDDHDQQNPGSSSRSMDDKGSVLVRDKNVNSHRSFEVNLFNRRDNDWVIRNVLSSYSLMESGSTGVPDGKSSCSGYLGAPANCLTTEYTPAHDPNACGYSMIVNGAWTENKYTRVHRDRSIILAMRGWMGLSTSVSNADIGLPANCS